MNQLSTKDGTTENPVSGREPSYFAPNIRHSLMLLLRVITLFAPMRIFLRISLALVIPGLIYGLGMALLGGRGFPVLAALLINTGVVLGGIGLVADQISQMRLISLNRRSTDVDTERVDGHGDNTEATNKLESR